MRAYASHRATVRQLFGCPSELGQTSERSFFGGPVIVFDCRMARSDSAAGPKGAQSCEMGNARIAARNRARP